MPKPIGRWNPTRSLWETDRFDLLSEHLEPFSETWPTSGSMRSGSAFERPTSAPHTRGSGSSSSRRLPTPEAKLAASGPDYGRSSRPGSGGDDLTTAIDRLLPTPMQADGERTSTRHGRGNPTLGGAVTASVMRGTLLPTPSAAMRNDSETPEEWAERFERHASKTDGTATRAGTPLEILAQALARTGDPTVPRSPDGSDASDE